ncbi:MAG TPA: Flp pilus assembly protein CpaB [Hyphomicrobiaceae bacterium]|nr:Flp pilus assembly protein CpaB [Hyphomicrobiaceae bacterium]
MKKGQIITLGVAAICGIGAVFVMSNFMNSKPKELVVEKQINTTQVLVAKTEIGLGQIVSREHFRWQDWPQGAVAAGYIQNRQTGGKDPQMALIGSVARAPILKDEPITANKLVKPGEGGVLAAILPAGMRAISTRIKEETAVGKLILPNDHVDVILIQRRRSKNGGEDFVADTLFRNVRVLAIGQLIEVKEGKKGAEGATATLELTPRQSELLALANSMGEISLALRSVADAGVGAGPSAGNGLGGNRGNSVRVLRYGVKSRAYGVN